MPEPSSPTRVIVTGAGSPQDAPGCGAAIALRFAAAGSVVAVLDRDASAAQRTVDHVTGSSGTAFGVIADLGTPTGCGDALRESLDRLGGVDVLVNNVGAVVHATVADLTDDMWDLAIAVNLGSAMRMSRGVLPHMIGQGRGSIVNIASSVGPRGVGYAAAYGAAKAGLLGLTKEMAVAHGPQGVRVNAVIPGHIYTSMVQRVHPDPALRALRRDLGPLRTEGTPEDIAEAVHFLASDAARWINGIEVPVDAGMLAALPLASANRLRRR